MSSTTPKVKLEGVSDVNKSVFDSMTEGQRSRVLSASVGTNVEGINVTENIQHQLRKYETAQVQLGSLIKSPVETGSAPVTSPTVKPKPRREAPGPRPKASSNTIIQDSKPKVPANATPTSSASGGGGQNTVPNFSSTDSMNTETLIIKSIYSLVV